MDKFLTGVKVDSVLNVCFAEEELTVTLYAFEAIWTLPVAFRHLYKLWLETPEVVHLVAYSTNQ